MQEAKVKRFMKKVVVSVVALIAGFASVAQAFNVSDAPKSSVYVSREYVHDYVADVFPIAPDAKCGQWWEMLHDQGWNEKDIVKADSIIFRESRCNPKSINSDDPTRIGKFKGSFGLFQINLFWISKTTAYPKGFLQTNLERNLVPNDLLNPEINALSALAIINYNRAGGGCGWSAWNGC
jgi:hypothetical protein